MGKVNKHSCGAGNEYWAATMTARQPQIFAKPDHFIACSNFRASPNKA